MLNKSVGKIRVVIAGCPADLSDSVRGAMAGCEIIDDVSCGNGIFDIVAASRPDVVILGIDELGLAGIELAQKVKLAHPSLVVALSMSEDNDDWYFAALRSGVNACLNWNTQPSEFLDTIKQAVQGEYPIVRTIFRQGVASRIISEFASAANVSEGRTVVSSRLLPLEAEVLQHITKGSHLGQIAGDMHISEDTVRQRLYTILGKLIANYRTSHLIHVKQAS